MACGLASGLTIILVCFKAAAAGESLGRQRWQVRLRGHWQPGTLGCYELMAFCHAYLPSVLCFCWASAYMCTALLLIVTLNGLLPVECSEISMGNAWLPTSSHARRACVVHTQRYRATRSCLRPMEAAGCVQGVARILAQGALMLACSCAVACIGLQKRTSVDAMQQAPSSALDSGGQPPTRSPCFAVLCRPSEDCCCGAALRFAWSSSVADPCLSKDEWGREGD